MGRGGAVGDGDPVHRGGQAHPPDPEEGGDLHPLRDGRHGPGCPVHGLALEPVLYPERRRRCHWHRRGHPALGGAGDGFELLRGALVLPLGLVASHRDAGFRHVLRFSQQHGPGLRPVPRHQRCRKIAVPDGADRRAGHPGGGGGRRCQTGRRQGAVLALAHLRAGWGHGPGLGRGLTCCCRR